MSNAKHEMGAIYDAMRCELIHLLMEHRSQGRFTRATQGTDEERSLFLVDLTRSISDVLIAAYPIKDSTAYATALGDARTIASAVLDGGLLTSS
jgi:hypothetical protein